MSYRRNREYSDDDDYNLGDDELSDKRIQVLSNLSNSSFLDTLRDCSKDLSEEEAPDFFRIVLGHFEDTNLKDKYGKEILISIRKIIRKNDIFDVFKNKKEILRLPFIYKVYNDEVYAIIYDVVNRDPSVLDTEFCDQDHFVNSVKEDPRKALSIIFIFANKLIDNPDSYPSPWPLLRLLIDHANLFIIPELVECYVSILCKLCCECEPYSNECIEDVWKTLVKYTSKTSIECHKSIYLGLTNILEANSEHEFELTVPLEALKNDLTQKITQEAALIFIYQFAESDDSNANKLNDSELFETLFSIDNENAKKASVILMHLADKNQKLAEKILNCQNGTWMLVPHPDASYTLRIFLTIFSYENLRNQITEMKNFVPFLIYCMERLSSPGIITIVTAIVRRVKLDNAVVSRLTRKSNSSESFIQLYIKEVNKHQDETNLTFHSLLLMINALVKANPNCADHFLKAIPTVKNLLYDENLSLIASYAAADLSSNEVCLDKMVELKIHHFFKDHLKDEKSKALRHNAKQFFRNKKKFQDGSLPKKSI